MSSVLIHLHQVRGSSHGETLQ